MTSTLSKIDRISELLNQGIQCWREAGELLCQHLDAGASINEVAEQSKVPQSVLEQLERIGRKQILPCLLISDYPAARMMEKLPYSEQSRLQDESIPLLLDTNEILNVAADEMTKRQAKQAFAPGHVRSISEQKAWLAEQRSIAVPLVTIQTPYTVGRGKVTFHSACEMSRSVLLRILGELE